MKLKKLAVSCTLAPPFLYGCTNDSVEGSVILPPADLGFETVPTIRSRENMEGYFTVEASSRIVVAPDLNRA